MEREAFTVNRRPIVGCVLVLLVLLLVVGIVAGKLFEWALQADPRMSAMPEGLRRVLSVLFKVVLSIVAIAILFSIARPIFNKHGLVLTDETVHDRTGGFGPIPWDRIDGVTRRGDVLELRMKDAEPPYSSLPDATGRFLRRFGKQRDRGPVINLGYLDEPHKAEAAIEWHLRRRRPNKEDGESRET